MPLMPCPQKVDCPIEGPLINYSSEVVDLREFISVVYNHNQPPPINQDWTATGCIGVCTSTVSQQEADLCAQRQAIECVSNPPPEILFYNLEQTCSVDCPDGSVFTYVVPAGIFVGFSQAEVDAQAASYACQQANLRKLCLNNIPRCFCDGVDPGPIQVTATGDTRALTFILTEGSLPTGMTLDQSVQSDMQTLITGIPTVSGNFAFTIQALEAGGSFALRTYTMFVIEITTASLPAFTVGTAYSHQMTATGGSGDYAWRIVSGTLPAGLTMSLSGLISGTPTGGSSTTLIFDVIDLECAETDRTFFPPQISMTTVATTRVATVIGYPEFTDPSTPPKKYKKLTWTGTSEQTAVCLGRLGGVDYSGVNCARAKYEWSGTAEINNQGGQESLYEKLFYQACPNATEWPRNVIVPNPTQLIALKGYCWPQDPNSCGTCQNPPAFSEDVQTNSIADSSDFARNNNPANVVDQTHFGSHGTATGLAILEGAEVFPQTTINDRFGAWVRVDATHDYDGLLEEEYTDAIALANAEVYAASGSVAQTTPRTNGFISRFTSVVYSLLCTNLIVGEDYTVRVRFYNTKTGASTFRTVTFIAASTTEVISDTVPTPVAFQPLQVRDPVISFTP